MVKHIYNNANDFALDIIKTLSKEWEKEKATSVMLVSFDPHTTITVYNRIKEYLGFHTNYGYNMKMSLNQEDMYNLPSDIYFVTEISFQVEDKKVKSITYIMNEDGTLLCHNNIVYLDNDFKEKCKNNLLKIGIVNDIHYVIDSKYSKLLDMSKDTKEHIVTDNKTSYDKDKSIKSTDKDLLDKSCDHHFECHLEHCNDNCKRNETKCDCCEEVNETDEFLDIQHMSFHYTDEDGKDKMITCSTNDKRFLMHMMEYIINMNDLLTTK